MRHALRSAVGLAALVFLPTLGATLAQDAKAPAPESKPARGRVVLVSLDGLRPEVYLDDRFKAPNLRALAARGIKAQKVVGIFPTVTYPSHASLATGCRPARHGIVANTVFDAHDGGKRWYWEACHLRATPLWEAAKKAGSTTSAIQWPTTVGAEIDWHLPEVFGADDDADHWALVQKHSTPGLLDHLGIKRPADYWDEAAIDERAVSAACRIIQEHKPELLMIHLVAGDGAQHHGGRDDEGVFQAYAKLDQQVGELVHALGVAGLGSSTNVLVTGDHGFMDAHTNVKPNAILREAGFLKVDDKGKVLDWTAYCQTSGGSAAIYLRDPSDRATGERVLAALRASATQLRGVMNLLDREACDREEAFPGALCALDCEPGYCFAGDARGEPLSAARVRGMHGYLPSRPELWTGFVAAGPGLAVGRTIPQMRMIDIAPTAARLLGCDLGPAVQGTVVPGILAPVAK